MFSCAVKVEPANLPKDILGIKVGMKKEDAEKRLREIGKFSRDDVQRQQVWSLRDNTHFGYVVLKYDEENQINYITAIAKATGGQPMKFTDVGDISKAKAEISQSSRRYVWEVPADADGAARSVIAQGGNADSLSMLSIAAVQDKEEEEEERGEKK